MSGITDPTEEFFKDGCWGWDGSQWRKVGIPLWYNAPVGEYPSNLDAQSGVNSLTGSTVPAGELWIIESASAIDNTSALDYVAIRVNTGKLWTPLITKKSVAAAEEVIVNVEVVLSPGYYLFATFSNCAAGDNSCFRYIGYKVKIT